MVRTGSNGSVFCDNKLHHLPLRRDAAFLKHFIVLVGELKNEKYTSGESIRQEKATPESYQMNVFEMVNCRLR